MNLSLDTLNAHQLIVSNIVETLNKEVSADSVDVLYSCDEGRVANNYNTKVQIVTSDDLGTMRFEVSIAHSISYEYIEVFIANKGYFKFNPTNTLKEVIDFIKVSHEEAL